MKKQDRRTKNNQTTIKTKMGQEQVNEGEKSNELPALEILGEWDHGMLDPVLPAASQGDDQEQGPHPIISYRDIQTKVLQAESCVEDTVRTTLDKLDHAAEISLEKLDHAADTVSRHTTQGCSQPVEEVDARMWDCL